MNKHIHKLTASGLAMSLAVIGCTPTANVGRPAALSSVAASPKLEKDSAKLYAQAQVAVKAGNMAEALSLAERTVELSPRDIGYRMLLGDLYLKNGRFASAETSFSDVTALDPGNVRAGLSLALTMIAQGKQLMAMAELEKLDGTAPAGDLGLAYALAGEHARALSLLEPAAREVNASGRVRQNLALAYALSGDWQKARVTASQDVSAADLPARMEQWAALANPDSSYTQVAALLGVTPVADEGQPVRLALAPAESEVSVALAEAAPIEAVPAAPAPIMAARVAAATVAPVAIVASPPAPVITAPISAAPNKLAVIPVQFAAAAAEALVKPSPAVLKQPMLEAAPMPLFKPAKVTKFETRPAKPAAGRYVVQIGAYRHIVQAERAWGDAQRRYGLNAKQALSTTVTLPGRGTFHRLSVAPFQAPGDAAKACGTIRARGGTCFVRTVAGDAPLQYAARSGRRG